MDYAERVEGALVFKFKLINHLVYKMHHIFFITKTLILSNQHLKT